MIAAAARQLLFDSSVWAARASARLSGLPLGRQGFRWAFYFLLYSLLFQGFPDIFQKITYKYTKSIDVQLPIASNDSSQLAIR